MIVDLPLIVDAAVGGDKRIIEVGDTQLKVPPAVFPQMPLLRPTRLNGGAISATDLQNTSFIHRTSQFVQPPATAAVTTTIFTLDKGMWELDVELSIGYDYAAALGTWDAQSNAIIFQVGTNQVTVHTVPAFVGSAVFNWFNRYLFLTPVIVRLVQSLTAAGQNNVMSVNWNCVKIL